MCIRDSPDNPRPDHNKYPKVNSAYMDLMDYVIDQIFELNRIRCHCIYRINANSVFPQPTGGILTQPHIDHQFPHKNMLIYLTDSGGDTICFDNDGKKHHYTPAEDDIVEFQGLHCMQPPKDKRRVVIVVTYLDEDLEPYQTKWNTDQWRD